jgi:hypothetical protein
MNDPGEIGAVALGAIATPASRGVPATADNETLSWLLS